MPKLVKGSDGRFRLGWAEEEMTDPNDPVVSLEDGIGCDGECGHSWFDQNGIVEPPLHYHLVERQAGAATRYWFVSDLSSTE